MIEVGAAGVEVAAAGVIEVCVHRFLEIRQAAQRSPRFNRRYCNRHPLGLATGMAGVFVVSAEVGGVAAVVMSMAGALVAGVVAGVAMIS